MSGSQKKSITEGTNIKGGIINSENTTNRPPEPKGQAPKKPQNNKSTDSKNER